MPDNRDIDLNVKGTDDGASDVLKKTTDAAKTLTDTLHQTNTASENTAKVLPKAFDPAPITATSQRIAQIQTQLKTINESTMNMRGLFDLNAISQGGMMLQRYGGMMQEAGAKWTSGAETNQASAAKLNAMMEKRGDGGHIEELTDWAEKLSMASGQISDTTIKDASAGLEGFGMNAKQIEGIMPGMIGQSRLYKESLSEVAMEMGKAFSTGNVGMLRRTGIVIDDDTMKRIHAITDEGERQKAVYDAVQVSLQKYALNMNQGMGSAEMASDRAALAVERAQESFGHGAESATSQLDTLKAGLISASTAWGPLDYAIGYGTTVIGGSVKALGGLIYTVAETSRAIIGSLDLYHRWNAAKQEKILKTELETLTSEENTAATEANAAAQVSQGAASDVAAAGMETEAAAAGTATAATGGFTLSTIAAKSGIIGLAIAAGVGLGAALDAVIDKFHKSGNAIYDNLSAMDKLKLKWDALKDYFHIGSDNQVEGQYGIQKANIEYQYDKNRMGGMTADAAAKIRDAANLKLEQNAAKMEQNDPSNLAAHVQQIDDLQQQQQVTQAVSAATAPSMPAADTGSAPSSPKAVANESKIAAKEAKAEGKLQLADFKDGIKEQKAEMKTQHDQKMHDLKTERELQKLNNKISLDEAKEHGAKAKESAKLQQEVLQLTAQRNAIMGLAHAHAAMTGVGEMGGRAYSHINADGTVTNFSGNGQQQATPQLITLHPKTNVTRASDGGFDIAILPEKFHIPSDFHNSVRGL